MIDEFVRFQTLAEHREKFLETINRIKKSTSASFSGPLRGGQTTFTGSLAGVVTGTQGPTTIVNGTFTMMPDFGSTTFVNGITLTIGQQLAIVIANGMLTAN